MGKAVKKMRPIWVLFPAGLFWVAVEVCVVAAEMCPNTLVRIPLLTLPDPIWELTTLEMIDRTQSHAKFAEFPIAMDVKNFHEDTSLTVVSDAGWCQIVLLKTAWDQEHESMQSHIRGYGGWGYHEERFRFPVGVEIGGYDGFFDPNEDCIYVCDSGNGRIVMLTYVSMENNVEWAGSFGEEQLLCPQGVAYFDNHTEDRYDDIVFVTDMDNAHILYFSAAGQYLGAYDLGGHGLGELSSPISICRGSINTEWSSNLYVTDTYNFKVCCFRWYAGELQFVDELSFYDLPRSQLMGITTDYQGFVYVADRTRDRLLKISPSMNLVAIIDGEVSLSYDFTEPIGLRFYDGALTVINKYSETSGFMCFSVSYLDSLR